MRIVKSKFEFPELVALFFIVLCLVFPRSYSEIKIPFIFIFIFSSILSSKVKINFWVFSFYFLLMVFACIWSFIGLGDQGDLRGVYDNFKLYFLWSLFYFTFFTLLINYQALKVFHNAILISSVIIAILNIVTVFFAAKGVQVFPVDFHKNMELRVGFHAGYIQVTSHNIGSLFFIAPYLISCFLSKKFREHFDFKHKISLFLCLLIVVVSGRRALWITVFMSPLVFLITSFIFSRFKNVKFRKTIITFYFIFPVAALFLLKLIESKTLEHLLLAFSSADERTIQSGYLIKGFLENPIIGNGFGSSVEYLRSDEAPWLYEMTYHQLLFNVGVVGILIIGFLFLLYFYIASKFIKKSTICSEYVHFLLIGLLSLAIGAYSNPYFGSFDFILLIGVLPMVAGYYSRKYPNKSNLKDFNRHKMNG